MTMETNDLINVLAHSPQRRPMSMAWLLLGVMIFAAIMTFAVIGLRPELYAGPLPSSFWMKTILLSWFAFLTFSELQRASRPVAAPRSRWPVMLFAAVFVVLLGMEWATQPMAVIFTGFVHRNLPACLIAVTVYGAIGMAAMTALMKRYAPTDMKHCAGMIGLAAASAGAVGYSIHCPMDGPTFILVAYGIPVAALWAIGRWALAKKLNW